MTLINFFSIIFHGIPRKLGFIMNVCFIGHKKIETNEKLLFNLTETVITLLNKGVTTFFFGSKSQFNDLAWEVVSKLKKDYPFITRVYVRSAFQHINSSYEKYLLTFYEKTYFPQNIEKAGKYSYVERNFEMIDKSTYCVFYYNENYTSTLKRNSGTKTAFLYARKKKKEIINLYKQ